MQTVNLTLTIGSLCILLSFCQLISSKAIEIDEDNWEELLSKGEWMVEFYAPWCPACNRFESVWNEFSSKSNELGIKVGSADVNANPVLSGLFSVTSLPTIYHIKDGQYRLFAGNRDLSKLVDFIEKKEWEQIDPSSSWLTPNSALMKGLSFLFKLTLYFKDVYTQLTETYGYPIWAVLTLFVIVTILIGLLLGVVFIVIIDFACPPKKASKDEIKETQDYDVIVEEITKSDKDSLPSKKEAKPTKSKAKKDN